MTYELAKKLKDAGFPYGKPFTSYDMAYIVGEEPMPIPTLEELIEACKKIKYERSWIRLGENPEMNGWIAEEGVTDMDSSPFTFAEGSTPIEAVANLWLKLQTK